MRCDDDDDDDTDEDTPPDCSEVKVELDNVCTIFANLADECLTPWYVLTAGPGMC